MRRSSHPGRQAERVLDGFDEAGDPERVVLWIERRADGSWAVGRAVNPQHRQTDEPRPDDYVCEAWELDEALEQANAALEDDVVVLETDGELRHRVPPFTRNEIVPQLERLFFRGA